MQQALRGPHRVGGGGCSPSSPCHPKPPTSTASGAPSNHKSSGPLESESIVLRERLRSPLHPQGHTPVGKLSRHPQATIVFPREAHLGAKSPGGTAHGGEPSLGCHLCPVLRLGCALAGGTSSQGLEPGPLQGGPRPADPRILTASFILWMLGNPSTYLGTLPVPAIGTVVSNLESKVIFEGVCSAPLASRTNSSRRRGQTN